MSIDDFLDSVRGSLRSLARSPGTTVLAVLMLALGLGASPAVFSIVNAILLRPAPFDEPERVHQPASPVPRYRERCPRVTSCGTE